MFLIINWKSYINNTHIFSFCRYVSDLSVFHLAFYTISKRLSQTENKPHHEKVKDFCLCEYKGADQLCSNCTADQRLCFRYIDSMVPFLSIAKHSKVLAFSGLCTGRVWSETPNTGFSRRGTNDNLVSQCQSMSPANMN